MTRLITISELEYLTEAQVRAIYSRVLNDMVSIPQTDPAYLVAIASLQNIEMDPTNWTAR